MKPGCPLARNPRGRRGPGRRLTCLALPLAGLLLVGCARDKMIVPTPYPEAVAVACPRVTVPAAGPRPPLPIQKSTAAQPIDKLADFAMASLALSIAHINKVEHERDTLRALYDACTRSAPTSSP
jgi:hypothetical protein